MTRFRARQLPAAVTTAAVAMTVTGTLAFTTPAAAVPAPKAESKPKVLNWLAHKHSDSMPRSLRKGADWTSYAYLYDFMKDKPGKKIGDATAHCSAVEVTPYSVVAQCQSVLRTDHGSITLSGTVDHRRSGTYGGDAAITGGTGKYEDAEGQVEAVFHGDYAKLRVSLDD
ncbi:allene oxide cyclase barrel-like domain-containing protein [Streptomyces sp. NPDC055287]